MRKYDVIVVDAGIGGSAAAKTAVPFSTAFFRLIIAKPLQAL